jgi:hypothetical protein
MKRKQRKQRKQPKRVRCWMVEWPRGSNPIDVDWFPKKKTAVACKRYACTITPGYFVPDEAKAKAKAKR